MHYHTHHDETCEHSSPAQSGGYGPVIWASLIVTVIFVIAEAIIGLIAHSLALVSDAGHNLTDALSLGLSGYAIWVAKRPPNARKTFGYHRVAILSAFLNSLTLAAIGVGIFIGAAESFHTHTQIDTVLMLWTAIVAMVVNSSIVVILHGGAKDSINVRAAYIHMATDVISSIMVVITALIIHQTKLYILDPIISLVIGGMIFASGWKVIREATDILLEGAPRDLNMTGLVNDIRGITHVRAVHDLHVWTVADGLNYMSCHIEVADTQTMVECADVLRSVNDVVFNNHSIAHSTIQVEMAGACVGASELDPLYCGGTAPSLKPSPAIN